MVLRGHIVNGWDISATTHSVDALALDHRFSNENNICILCLIKTNPYYRLVSVHSRDFSLSNQQANNGLLGF